jgi:hypothetical protein
MELNWNIIGGYLRNTRTKIFDEYDKKTLSTLEKRFIIFNYLVNNYVYDYELYNDKIETKIGIHPWESMSRLINENKGVCSSLTPIYKFLLEAEGIPSIGCYCNTSDFAYKHMILLVKDESGWSFDDVSRAITDDDSIERLFGYDLFQAAQLAIPQREIIGCDSCYLDDIYFKPIGVYPNEKKSNDLWLILPENIKSLPNDEIGKLISSNLEIRGQR